MEKYFTQLNSVEWMASGAGMMPSDGNVTQPPYSDYEKKQLVDFCLNNNIISAKWKDFKMSVGCFGILCYQEPTTSSREFFSIFIPITITHRLSREGYNIEWISVHIYKEEDDYFYIRVEHPPNSEGFVGKLYKCDDLFGLKKFLEFYFQEIKNKYL